MRYYAVRYKSAPDQVRIEKAETAEKAFRLAFGVPPRILGDLPVTSEYVDLGTRVNVIRSTKKRLELLNNPTNWVTYK